VAPPRWLVDEMLGRLARYLRFVGCDTVYLRGVTDDELIERAEADGRVLLTRDRELSRRAPHAFLVESPFLAEQWHAVRSAWPEVPTAVRFDRCSLCNGLLEGTEGETGDAGPGGEQAASRPPAKTYRCGECGHLYWDGSHTYRIRAQIAEWERSAGT
jgi:uncharacterized protein